jgi:DNA-binding transcriptional LysR family regulator
VELRHLRYFVAVAEEGSLTRAADRLGIQQPPLGQQIRLLEQQLGVELFERRPRQIALSESGRFFLEEARAVLKSALEATERVRRFDRGESGFLNIGFTSSASLHALTPRILQRFHEAYPQAEVLVRESETYELVLALREGTIDAALFHISVERFPELQGRALADVDLMVALPNAHPLASAKAPVTLDVLLSEDFVVYRRRDGPGIFDHVDRAFARRATPIRVAGEVTRLIAAINLVAAGRGITLVPETMSGLHPESVTYLPLAAGVMPPLHLTLAFRRDVDLALVRNFLKVTETMASEDNAIRSHPVSR